MPDRLRFDSDATRQYLDELLPPEITQLDAPVPPNVGRVAPTIAPAAAQLLTVLIHAARPRRVLEIGTCSAYSVIAMGRALRLCDVGGPRASPDPTERQQARGPRAAPRPLS